MPRRSDIETAFRAAIVHEPSGRRVVKTVDFVNELQKFNWNYSLQKANRWIVTYTCCFRDITPHHGDDKLWFMFNLNGGI